MQRITFTLNGAHMHAKLIGAPMHSIAVSLARRLGSDVTLLDAEDSGHYRASWYDATAEVFRDGMCIVPSMMRR